MESICSPFPACSFKGKETQSLCLLWRKTITTLILLWLAAQVLFRKGFQKSTHEFSDSVFHLLGHTHTLLVLSLISRLRRAFLLPAVRVCSGEQKKWRNQKKKKREKKWLEGRHENQRLLLRLSEELSLEKTFPFYFAMLFQIHALI